LRHEIRKAQQYQFSKAEVATESLLVIATDVVQAPNDKQQIAPVRVSQHLDQLGRARMPASEGQHRSPRGPS
jgi:hypothetical protein